MNFEKDEQWWFNFLYRKDKERGQGFNEDLWTPGFFKCRINSDTNITFQAALSTINSSSCQPAINDINCESEIANLIEHQNYLIDTAKTKDENLQKLCLAADQFITTLQTDTARETKQNKPNRTTIMAGYPWFADWGRDALIALPGLLLSTGRFEEAKSVLTTFANAARDGLIPNRFDDNSHTAYFNSIDASLWFINAAFEYLETSKNVEIFTNQLLPKIEWIIDSYNKGTRFSTYADTDGLITSGNEQTQLTWMDAKYDGIAFTPRYGKSVEINSLWYNGIYHV